MSVKSFGRVVLAVAAAGLAACGSDEVGADRLDSVQAGMPKDSLMAIMGKGPLTGQFGDTLRLDHGFRVQRFLTGGKMFEVLYYREKPGDVSEPVAQFTETPVVLADGKVLGWGWEYYVEKGMGEFKLPTPIKEQPASAAGAPPKS
ncbi:MAG: DUF3192 domain-containing protein [Gemmatimonadetes bacterium]|nr:DUF3192 domain-containing protein [Gemmatimonadota bacterium]